MYQHQQSHRLRTNNSQSHLEGVGLTHLSPASILWDRRQTVQKQTRSRRTRRLIRFFTVCLQKILLKMKITNQQQIKRK